MKSAKYKLRFSLLKVFFLENIITLSILLWIQSRVFLFVCLFVVQKNQWDWIRSRCVICRPSLNDLFSILLLDSPLQRIEQNRNQSSRQKNQICPLGARSVQPNKADKHKLCSVHFSRAVLLTRGCTWDCPGELGKVWIPWLYIRISGTGTQGESFLKLPRQFHWAVRLEN